MNGLSFFLLYTIVFCLGVWIAKALDVVPHIVFEYCLLSLLFRQSFHFVLLHYSQQHGFAVILVIYRTKRNDETNHNDNRKHEYDCHLIRNHVLQKDF
jgi:hypothetical protein